MFGPDSWPRLEIFTVLMTEGNPTLSDLVHTPCFGARPGVSNVLKHKKVEMEICFICVYITSTSTQVAMTYTAMMS